MWFWESNVRRTLWQFENQRICVWSFLRKSICTNPNHHHLHSAPNAVHLYSFLLCTQRMLPYIQFRFCDRCKMLMSSLSCICIAQSSKANLELVLHPFLSVSARHPSYASPSRMVIGHLHWETSTGWPASAHGTREIGWHVKLEVASLVLGQLWLSPSQCTFCDASRPNGQQSFHCCSWERKLF